MNKPISVAVPHRLSREEARRRLTTRIGELPQHIPGGMAKVDSHWVDDDTMKLNVSAMGQDVGATILVRDAELAVTIMLPAMLSFLAGPIQAAIAHKGDTLLLDKDDGPPRA